MLAIGAFASLQHDLFDVSLGRISLAETLMWGKVLYHAEVDAPETLQDIPCFFIAPEPGRVRDAKVVYNGSKGYNYVYGFPPIQYPDGKWRIKLGHSPVDPLIGQLGVSADDPSFGQYDF